MISESRSSSLTDERFWALVAVSLLAKAVLATVLPLSADESYYWVWSRHLDHGYFDHPPMVAWLFALGRIFEGFGHAVRLPAVLLGHGAVVVWALFLKDLLPPKRRLVWLALFLACPLTGIGGVIVTPDLPLIFFWSLSLLFIKRILNEGKSGDFLALGAALGLGFCSKYMITLLPLSLLLLAFDARIRSALWRPALFLTFMSGLIFCAPVLGWNASHDWASFRFQLGHGLKSQNFSWIWPIEYLLGQILVLFPPLLFFSLKKGMPNPIRRILLATAFAPLAFFFFTSFRAPVELNWPSMAYPSFFALAAASVGRRTFVGNMIFWTTVQIAMIISVFYPATFRLHEKLSEPTKYRVLADLPNTHSPLYASTYQMASSLWYVSGRPVYKLQGMSRYDMYDRWDGSLPSLGRFYLLKEQGQEFPQKKDGTPFDSRFVTSPAPGLELWEVFQ